MKKVDINKMFETAEKLYSKELKKSGMTIIPFSWVKNDETGEMIIYTPYSNMAEFILKKLSIGVA